MTTPLFMRSPAHTHLVKQVLKGLTSLPSQILCVGHNEKIMNKNEHVSALASQTLAQQLRQQKKAVLRCHSQLVRRKSAEWGPWQSVSV